MTITNLDPGTTYQMRVVAKNGVGLESSAEWQEVTTGGLGKFRLFHGSQPPSSGVASGEGGKGGTCPRCRFWGRGHQMAKVSFFNIAERAKVRMDGLCILVYRIPLMDRPLRMSMLP